jgi:hypothetical protein
VIDGSASEQKIRLNLERTRIVSKQYSQQEATMTGMLYIYDKSSEIDREQAAGRFDDDDDVMTTVYQTASAMTHGQKITQARDR